MIEWIKCEDRLPPEGELVLICFGVNNYDVARIEYGISEEERTKMKNGEIDDPVDYGFNASGLIMSTRSEVYKPADQWLNNKQPYCFRVKSGYTIFSQNVKAWCKIPKWGN